MQYYKIKNNFLYLWQFQEQDLGVKMYLIPEACLHMMCSHQYSHCHVYLHQCFLIFLCISPLFWHLSSCSLPFQSFLCHCSPLCLKVCHYCLHLSIKIALWISFFSFRPLSLCFLSREWVSSTWGERLVCSHNILQRASDLCYRFNGVTIW